MSCILKIIVRSHKNNSTRLIIFVIKCFQLFSQLQQNQMMNQHNTWFFMYVFPQYVCQNVLKFKEEPVQSIEKVEQQKRFENFQENKFYNHTNLPQNVKFQRKHQENHLKNQQDSSFSLPVKQQNKTGLQKLGRNSISNILRMFTKMLKTRIFRQKFDKLKQKLNIEVTYKQFTSWTTGIGLNINKYIRIKKILNGTRSKPHFGKLLAILYQVFQSQYARPAVLTSSKTQSKNIYPTLLQIRNINEEIKNAVIVGFDALNKSGKKK